MESLRSINKFKIQNDPFTVVPNGIITGSPGFAKRCDTNFGNVLVIEY